MATRSARSRQAVARLAWVSPDGLAQAEAAREAFGLGIKQAVEKFLLAGIEAAVAVVPPEGGLAAHGVDHGLVELGGGDQLLQKPDQPVGEIEIAPLAMLQHGVVTLPLAQDLGRKTQGAAHQHLTAGRASCLSQETVADRSGQAAIAVVVGVEGEKPEVDQPGAQQAIKIGGWVSDPGQKLLKLGLQIRSRRCLEVEPLASDRARQHLHRVVAAQFTDADGPQPIWPVGKQAAVPLMQAGQSERLVELAGGGQQHIQQSLHLGGGLRLTIGQRKAKAACDRGAHLARVELFAFDGGGAQAFAAQQGRHRFLGQGCFQGTNPLQQLLTGLVGLIEQGL